MLQHKGYTMKISPAELHRKIFDLTYRDLQNKSENALYASLLEEIGELARELKIEYAVFGNTYKKPDEGIKGEAVDVYICCVAMLYAERVGKTTQEKHDASITFLDSIVYGLARTSMMKSELGFHENTEEDKAFRYLRELNNSVNRGSYLNSTGISAASYAMMIYNLTGADAVEFWEIMSNKLDKWEKSQNGKLENLET